MKSRIAITLAAAAIFAAVAPPAVAATARGTATVRIVRPTLVAVEAASTPQDEHHARLRVLSGNELTGATVAAIPHPDSAVLSTGQEVPTESTKAEPVLLVYHAN